MKITNLSLAAIATMALTTGAMADVDMNIGGQAVVYYQTVENGGDSELFNEGNSKANAGIQLNANADLGNDFGLGLQGTALNTFGLEDNLVSKPMQSGLGHNGDTANASNYFAITKAYLTKKVGNTTLKLGRQELPKSLSPLAFSESWNVYKNTFDAIVAINTDIPDTTLVGAYVDRSNKHGDLSTFDNLTAAGGQVRPGNGAYMLTAQNKSLDGLAVTGSYYSIIAGANEPGYTYKNLQGNDVNVTSSVPHVDALWLDAQIDLNKLAGTPVTVGLQGGQTKVKGGDAKQAAGIKVAGKAGPANVSLAYTKTGTKGDVSIQNVGTGVKTPLYTQMVANQGNIASGADTAVLKVVAPAGPGKVIAQYGMVTDNSANKNDSNELDLIYKFKALGTNMLAAYVRTDADKAKDPTNIIRVWSRYNF